MQTEFIAILMAQIGPIRTHMGLIWTHMGRHRPVGGPGPALSHKEGGAILQISYFCISLKS